MLGIVGGLAGGKSTAARLLAKRGARVVDADAIGHEVLRRPDVKEALASAFGDDVVRAEGCVDHARLAEAVFGDAERVRRLNSIVHPVIINLIRREVARLRRTPDVPLVVLDAPLLLETGLHTQMCQAVLFVDAPAQLRRERAKRERGLTPEQFARREQAQLPLDAKARAADYCVTNAGSVEELDRRLDALWPKLCKPKGGVRLETQP